LHSSDLSGRSFPHHIPFFRYNLSTLGAQLHESVQIPAINTASVAAHRKKQITYYINLTYQSSNAIESDNTVAGNMSNPAGHQQVINISFTI